MSRKGLRPIAVMLSLLLLTAGPAQASPIRFADVVAQAVATSVGGRQTYDLHLRSNLPQSGRAAANSGTQVQTPSGSTTTGQGPATAPADTSANPSVTNTEVQPQGQGGNVEVVQLGDVAGTVCDCGDILIPEAGRSFPKLPFLALAGIPLLFINRDKDITPPGPTPPPPPTPPQVPEPATLLLLGSGLAALAGGARRRRAAQLRRHTALPTIAGEV